MELMNNLTQKEASGKWQVRGIAWEDLQEGKVITKEAGQRLYGCLCKLKDYEKSGLSPAQIQNWMYELEDMAGHVCDDLCRYRHDAQDQDWLDRICEACPVSACRGRIMRGKPDEEEPVGSSGWKGTFMQRFCRVD